jgi:hypothetical protein
MSGALGTVINYEGGDSVVVRLDDGQVTVVGGESVAAWVGR